MSTTLLIVLLVLFVLVCGTTLLLTRMIIEKDLKTRAIENGQTIKSVVVPLRLQAYERMALFLERIEPNQLVMRIHATELTALQEQNLLLTAIRTEFEHNLSQQIYISNQVWRVVLEAKDEIIAMINATAKTVGSDADSLVFAEALLNKAAETSVVDKALLVLKADIQKLF